MSFHLPAQVSALRRLQREAFQDLLQLKERVGKLEFATGISPAHAPHLLAARPVTGSVLSRTRLTGIPFVVQRNDVGMG